MARRRLHSGRDRRPPDRAPSGPPGPVLRPRRARALSRGLERVQGPASLPGLLRASHALVLPRAVAVLPLVRGGPVVRKRPALPDLRARRFARADRAVGGARLSAGTAAGWSPGGAAGGAVLR